VPLSDPQKLCNNINWLEVPHTDILGERGAGDKRALITDYDKLEGIGIDLAIKESGIIPDYIMPCP